MHGEMSMTRVPGAVITGGVTGGVVTDGVVGGGGVRMTLTSSIKGHLSKVHPVRVLIKGEL